MALYGIKWSLTVVSAFEKVNQSGQRFTPNLKFSTKFVEPFATEEAGNFMLHNYLS